MKTNLEYKPFIITIDDGYGKYQYNMRFPEDVAIYDIVKTIAEKFQVEIPEGKYLAKKDVRFLLEEEHEMDCEGSCRN